MLQNAYNRALSRGWGRTANQTPDIPARNLFVEMQGQVTASLPVQVIRVKPHLPDSREIAANKDMDPAKPASVPALKDLQVTPWYGPVL